jgi:hypothetical protein
MMSQWKACWIMVTAALLFALPCCREAAGVVVIKESAQLGTTGRIGGTSITLSHFVGWRFQVTEPLIVQRVGGHLFSIPTEPGDIFAAIVRLPTVDAIPQGAPFTTEEVVATTTFRPPFPSNEVLTPLSAVLTPGAYALMFGTGLYGATGAGGIHNGPDQPNITPTTQSSYIFWGIAFPNQPPVWRTGLASNMRFVVESLLRVPGDYDLDGDVDGGDYNLWKTDYGSTTKLAADGNGNGSIDTADYVIWRNNLTANGGSAALGIGGVAAPEPATWGLVAAAALIIVGRGRGQRPKASGGVAA